MIKKPDKRKRISVSLLESDYNKLYKIAKNKRYSMSVQAELYISDAMKKIISAGDESK
jgi:hypothetical protein